MIKTIYKQNSEKPADFYGRLRERWGDTIFTVRAEKPDPQLGDWCLESPGGEFTHSHGFEKFYFSNDKDALKFILVHSGKLEENR